MRICICFLAGFAMVMAENTYPYETENDLLVASTQFTVNLFEEVAKENPGKSVVMSGFSVMAPLAQLGLASVGSSHDEILNVLGLRNENTTKAVFEFANGQLKSRAGIDLKIANSVYIPEGYELNDEFNAVSRDVFHSDVKQVDFTKNNEAASKINTWVEDNTNNRIKNLIDPKSLGSDTKAIIVNAIYFKGGWRLSEKFDPKLTQERDFQISKDKMVKVPTMFMNSMYRFKASEEFDAKFLEIPYEDDFASFIVVLPNQVDGVTALEQKLKQKPDVLTDYIRNLVQTEVDLYLPKFKIETTISLKSVLNKIGVKSLFDPANSKLEKLVKNGNDIYITDAIQKAFIEVNEEGAEAAAASGFFGVGASFFIPDKQTFVADHPFLFFIVDRNRILFNGVYYGEVN
ncbi:unnamed protein product [Chilo suppressalis]|uniref:Serpin domain-containing protein n=2 Tax=Chilo suppressalis TaxID=168631 RepID=A0ABN8BCC8_CHISP|nr:unnamed protein product [Chilo suppressalis]